MMKKILRPPNKIARDVLHVKKKVLHAKIDKINGNL
jgi:hypothetical protein